jgi:hypothetical protein
MGLKDQLEAKKRRRLVVPIQISDPSEDHEIYMGVAVALQQAQQREDNGAVVAQLETQLVAAGEKVRSHYADVELLAMRRDDWNAAMAAWQGDDDIDWAEALAPLLAESCVDDDLRSVEWWRQQLGRDEWTEGDTDALKSGLLQLNVMRMEARYPKD